MKPYSIFACESQPIAVEGLKSVLATSEDFVFAGSVPVGADALAEIAVRKPDVVLLDQSMGLRAALQLVSEARVTAPESQAVLWVNELGEMESLRCLQNGARGILKRTQPIQVLLDCLRAVVAGNLWFETGVARAVENLDARRSVPRFTPREREIVELVCRGLKNRQIAEMLAITPGTVKVHLMHVFEKTGVRDRFELAMQGSHLLEPGPVAGGSGVPSRELAS